MSRIDKVNEFVKQEVSKALAKLEDPGIGFITVLKADTNKDLKNSRVYVSILSQDPEKNFKRLTKRRGEVQEIVNRNFNFKYTPKIEFFLDRGGENIDKIEGLIKELNEE